MIYLDHAATSFPKAPEIAIAIQQYLDVAANPGRSGHPLSMSAARIIYDTREKLADFFQVDNPLQVVFTQNATHAINIVMRGLLKPNDKVLVSQTAHNAIMRTANDLKSRGVNIIVAPPEKISDAIILEKPTLLAVEHANNVDGAIYPVETWCEIAKQNSCLTLIDVAQSAGSVPITFECDYLAITGHKSLGGPQGIGALIIKENTPQLAPLITGGTGSQSESDVQPNFLPDALESGTPNGVGIAGLGGALSLLDKSSIETHLKYKQHLIQMLIQGLNTIPEIKIYCANLTQNSGILSFSHPKKTVSEIGYELSEKYQIYTRVGLHCAPQAHQYLGSFSEGTVRLSVAHTHTESEINTVIEAIKEILK